MTCLNIDGSGKKKKTKKKTKKTTKTKQKRQEKQNKKDNKNKNLTFWEVENCYSKNI